MGAKRIYRRRQIEGCIDDVVSITHIDRATVAKVLTVYWKVRYKVSRRNCDESGRKFGRSRSMSLEQLQRANEMHCIEGVGYDKIARSLGVPKTTLVRSLKRFRRENALWRRALIARGSLRKD
jgi:hypothetical protein